MSSYSLGVDLGTTFSAAATVDDTGIPAMVGLGNRSMQIPSVLYVGADGEVLVGEPAERRATDDPTRIVREFKRRMGDSVAIYVGGKPFPIEQLTARLLRWVIDQTAERMGEQPAQLTLTHPASWTEFNIGKLRRAAEIAGFPDVTMCPEPVAAAFQHARNNLVRVGDRMAIYDLGGGTFDVCVVAKTVDGFEILGSPSGIDPLGGIDFDKVVIDRVKDELALLSLEADPEDAGYWRLGRDSVDAKEALSTDVDVTIPIAIGGLTTSLRLTRSEFESMIDEKLDETILVTQRALRSAGLTSADLTAFVLVGGSSRIPLVSEKLTQAFHCPMALNTHPKHEVALGAALAGRPVATDPVATDPVATDLPANDSVATAATAIDPATATEGRVLDPRQRATPVVPARSAHRWRRRTLISAGVLAIVSAVLVGGSLLIAPGAVDAARAEGSLQQGGTTVSTTSASASVPVSSTAPTSTSPSSTPPSTLPSTEISTTDPTSAVAPLTEIAPTSATAVPPDTLDATSVAWLRTQCGGAYQIQQVTVTQTKFRNVEAGRLAYLNSYQQQAAIAGRTAAILSTTGSAPIAGGRIDTQAAISGWHVLTDILARGAQTMMSLTRGTATDIDAANNDITQQVKDHYDFADMKHLSRDEYDFVATLPGCEVLAG